MIPAESLRSLILLREVTASARMLAEAVERAGAVLHRDDGLTAVQRDLLVCLLDGPRTVPAIAATHDVSRQSVQSLVNVLLRRGLVRAGPNPRHRRSPRIELTPAGRAAVVEMRRREGRVAAGFVARLDAGALEETARTLREVAALVSLETGPDAAGS